MLTILPGIGERLMCTSSGDKKILTTVPGDCGSIRVTRPSAGDTTTSGSDGGTRFGCRKKNAIKSATMNRIADTYQYPNAATATPNIAGTKIYGILSLTNLNQPAPFVRLCSAPFTSKGTRNCCSTSPSTFYARRNCPRSFSDSKSDFSDTATSSSTSDL